MLSELSWLARAQSFDSFQLDRLEIRLLASFFDGEKKVTEQISQSGRAETTEQKK